MDKYEYKLRSEEIRRLIADRQYREAVEIADTIDWRNVKNSTMLCTISDLYKMCKRFEDSRDVLLLAYQRNPGGKLIIYSLCELSIKLNDVVNAVEYYKEYLQVAPRDTGRYILQYKLYEAQGASLEERIAILEELQKRECKEKWMYELAYLYHRVGLGSSCVEQCNQVILFFGEGKYVVKALELKSLHEALSYDQDILYKRLTGVVEEEIIVPDMNVGEYNTIDLQRELADNLKDFLPEDQIGAHFKTENKEEIVEPVSDDTVVVPVEEIKEVSDETRVINIEAEVVEELPSKEEDASDEEPVADEDEKTNEEVSEPLTEEKEEETVTETAEEQEEEAPVEISEINEKPTSDPDVVEFTTDTVFETKSDEEEVVAEEDDGQMTIFDESRSVSLGKTLVYSRDEIEKALGGSKIDEDYINSTSSVNFDDMLALEGDGQISLVVPEQTMIEKQITGQLSIDEVLFEYEKIRQENEKKWTDGIRDRIEKSYDGILKDFNETSKDGLLEQLEDSIEKDPNSVPFGDNLTEEEIIYFEDELNAQKEASEEMLEEEIIIEEPENIEEEPSAEELTFDRTPYIEETSNEKDEEESDSPETESSEAGGASLDYLMNYAAAGEAKDLEEAAAIDAFEKSMMKLVEEEIQSSSEEEAREENTPEEKEEVESPSEEEETEAISEEDKEEEIAEEEKAEEVSEEVKTEEIPVSSPDEEDAEMGVKSEQITAEKTDEFTEEQWLRFESFLQTEFGREQIKLALETMSPVANTGNVIIGSVDSDSAIELGKELITEESKKGIISAKAHKIKASSLNAKDTKETFDKIYGGSIIIQDADELRKETLEEIMEAVSDPEKQILVILTVNHRQKHKFLMDNSELLEAFNVSIDIEALDNAELVKLAKEYAYSREFGLNEMGTLALHRRIDERQTNSHSVLLKEVKEMIDEAISHAQKKNVGHFFDILFGKRYDNNDMIVLGEKDFIE